MKNITISEEIDEKRYRHFMILLYHDTKDYNIDEILFDLKGSFKNYAYVLHNPESDEKKSHIHFILSFDNARTITSLCKRLNLKSQFIQPIKSLRASCRYLVHIDDETKTQYSLSDVHVSRSFSNIFFSSFDDIKSEQDIIDDIYNYIDTLVGIDIRTIYRDLTIFINSNSYDKIYRRYKMEFLNYLNIINKCS